MSPRCGHPDGDLGTAEVREPLLVQLGIGRRLGHQHLLGHAERGLLGIETFEHSIDQLGRRQVLGLVEHEPLAPHHPTLAHVEDLDGGFEVVAREPDDIEILALVADHLLLLDRPLHAGQPVAQTRRPLELQRVGRFGHLPLELLHDGVGVAVEELDQFVDEPLVLLGGDLADTWPRALLDVEQQARPAQALMAPELVVRARTDREGPQQQIEGFANGVGVAVRAEVAHSLSLAAAHHHGPRPLVTHGDGQERIALVVAQPHVEAGLMLLDERVLEHQRFDVVAHLDPLDRLGRLHHL